MSKRQSLEGWIQEAITDSDKDGKISAISCVHMIGTQSKEVHTVRFADRIASPKDLAALFYGKCESYSQDLPGQQIFCLQAFYNGRNEPEATHPFTVRTGEANLATGFSDPATIEGQTQQGIRHIEAMAQTYIKGMNALVYAQQEAINRAYMRAEHAESEQRASFEIIQKVMLEKLESDTKQKLAVLQYARETEERKQWLAFMPGLINNFLGKEIFPRNTEDTALIEAIAEELKPEQIQFLAGVIPPEKWGPLAARLNRYLEEKKKKQDTYTTTVKALMADAKGKPLDGKAEGLLLEEKREEGVQ